MEETDLLEPCKSNQEFVYAVFAQAMKQQYVTHELPKFFPCKAINPVLIKRKWIGRECKEITYSLMPGYIFLFSNERMNPGRLRKLDGILSVLKYDDGAYALTEKDEKLARWLLKYDGTIGLSKAIREGDHIQIVQGPLKDNIGSITRVDKHRKRAKIELQFNEVVWPVWMDFEFVELEGASV